MPPNANSLAAFWRFLLRGGNALRPIKKDRWDWRQYFDADPRRPGKTYAPKAASLDADLTQFDPLAFGMSPREAASLDPQQRLLLEVTWEAFEDAGIPLEKMAGSATGVFIGGFCLDHLVFSMQPANRHLANAHTPGGVMMTVLSNRLSHAFDLRGPSLTLDTACSSSLVSLHYACQSLRNEECDQALAGGVNVMSRPEFPIMMSKGHFLSPHGECHAFDESAAGYARGEGAGIFLLKRYEDAVAAGDVIHAVVRGTGVNQDGHTDGISLPNGDAQEALVREVYRQAGVAPGEVDYVEAHGTGTQAGDPAELGALHRTFAPGRERKLLVGSVKTNIGHLEAAAGVAGMLKAIAVLKHREVPKNLHFKKPNPRIPFADYCVEVAKETTRLPPADEKPTLFVGVNSFGYGGTNAHVVLESAPSMAAPAAGAPGGEPRLVPFSARDEGALRELAGKFAFQLGQGASGTFEDFVHAAAFRRSHLGVRAGVVAAGNEELRERLIALSTGEPHAGVVTAGRGGQAGPLAFVYTGMGPQWWGMGRELFRDEPIATAALDEIDALFRPLAGWSLKEAMLAPEAESRMARTELAQPANFAIQVALTRLWESHGIRPAAVVGHSVGEVGSAYVAGVYTLEEAVRISYHRSHLQQSMAGRGGMLAVGLPEADAERLIAGRPEVSVAAVNSFGAVTLSGDLAPLQRLAAELEAGGVFHKFLRVEVAYHSPQMESLREGILAALADLSPKPARIPLYSTAHGRMMPDEAWTAEIWWRNVRQPVRFAAAMKAMLADGYAAFLEVGPHPVLGNSIKECAAHLERKAATFVSLRRAEPERARMRLTLAELYCAGAAIDWAALAPAAGRFFPGPPYPWQRQPHWLESERSRIERLGRPGPVYLNRPVPGAHPAWEVEVNRNYFPFLFDHGVQNQTVFAGMGYVEAAITLSATVHGVPAVVLENVSFERVLVVDYAKIQVLRSECDAEGGRFAISCLVEGEEDSAQRQCHGRFFPVTPPSAPRVDLAAWRADCPRAVDVEAFHDDLRARGLHYGPAFRPTAEVRVDDDRFFVRIDAGAVRNEDLHALHPTLFDAAIQPVLFCARAGRLFVPFSIDRFHYFSRPAGAEVFAVGRLRRQAETMVVADVWLTDEAGGVHARAEGIVCQIIETENRAAPVELFYEMPWQASAPPESGLPPASEVLIVAEENSPLAAAIVEALPGASVASFESPVFSAERRRVIVLMDFACDALPADAGAAQDVRWIAVLRLLAAAHEGGEVDVTLVTRDAQLAGENAAGYGLAAIGLVAQNEFDAIRCRGIDLPAAPDAMDAARVLAEIAAATRGEIAWRGGERLVRGLARFRPAAATDEIVFRPVAEPLALEAGAKGKLDQLRFVPAVRRAPERGEVEVRVLSAALNHDDNLRLEGRATAGSRAGFFDAGPGMELVGEVARAGEGSPFAEGDRVVALAADAFRTYATLPSALVRPLPAGFGLEAAAIPVAFVVAWRGLVELAGLGVGERVLVHHATGGVGRAAVEVARRAGAEIFATAGTEEKRAWLRDLGIGHVFDSRTLDFAAEIQTLTAGAGVDVTIGAQSGPARRASLGLLRAGGRYVEIARRDLAADHELPLRAFQRNLQFVSIELDRLAADRPDLVAATLDRVLLEFARGALALPAARSFPANEIRAAFRASAEGSGIGKIWIDLSRGEVEVALPPAAAPLVRADGAYVVTGGTSGFGVVTARWLAEQGAGRIVLASRSGAKAAGIAAVVGELEQLGAQVEVISADVADPAQAADLLARADRGGFPLRGVVHGAMVLDDAMMADLTEESFRRVHAPKAVGAANLAAALPAEATLDFFVFSSSISAVIGNRGQTSYVAANAFLDGLAHRLRSRGVPALSINWGALAEAGVIARDQRLGAVLSTGGITGLTNRQAIEALTAAIRSGKSQLGAFLVDWPAWLGAHPKLVDDPRFRDLRARGAGPDNEAAARVRGELEGATREQRRQALEAHLRTVLGATLNMAPEAISVTQKLNELGVDSLMVLELSLGIEERIGARFSAMEFLQGPTLRQLAAGAETKLWPESD